MKKLFNGKVLIIIAACLVVLIGLGVGSFYLFDDADATFVKSGYVLNPLSEASEKYFFKKDTGYHENLSSMVEFVDVDDKEVSILADSFLHYDDGALSFLKNGAILDLDSINGGGAVKFYNITSASIIDVNNDAYIIKAKNGDIGLNNFIGRINDNKYIVVGDLQLKLTGNTNTIDGEYFEIVYVEEGVVNIENKDVKYQVMADDTIIRVGRDIVIDLGDKKIVSDDEDVMSITAITIDGNENVEIIPTVTVEEKPEGEGGTGNGNGEGGTGEGTGNGNGEAGGEGTGGTGQAGKPVDNVKEILITLKDIKISSTNIEVTFDIANAKEEDSFSLQVVNLNTGRTVDMVASVVSEVPITVSMLSPNTKYLFTVSNNKDGNKYFQKIFETAGFGIKLEKMYATSDSIAYKILIDEGTDITTAKLTLLKYNEETKQHEVVIDSYGEPCVSLIQPNGEGVIEGEIEKIYGGLESNTIYTAVLDEFSIASANFKDLYNVTLTSMTLKKTPDFSKMDVVTNAGAGQFELSLGEVIDPDNAIEKYTYKIYNKYTGEEAIKTEPKTNASPFIAKIGPGENELSNDTNYFYEVIIEYFDNEKFVEYKRTSEITFMMGNDPFITVAPDEKQISYDQIGGTIYLTDNSCLVSSPDREFCNEESTAVLVVSEVNPNTGDLSVITNRAFKFEVHDGVLKYDFLLTGLKEGTSYDIDVKAILNNDPKNKLVQITHTDESSEEITTKTLSSLNVNWNVDDYPSDSEHVVNAGAQLVGEAEDKEDEDVLSPEDTASSIKKIVLDLYEGEHVTGNSIATKAIVNIIESEEEEAFDIKTAFYDNMFNITTDGVFELTIDGLKALNKEEKLSEYYTIVIKAYYDEAGSKQIRLNNNVLTYEINKFLLLDNIDTPKLEVVEITNQASGYLFADLNNSKTVVGFKLSAAFDRAGLLQNNMEPRAIHFNVYNKNKKKVNFYIINDDEKLELVNSFVAELEESNFFEKKIYIDYGSDYYNNDAKMARGNDYYVGYEVEVLNSSEEGEGEVEMYPQVGPGKFENYKIVETAKETPLFKTYISKSTADSITYAYDIIDPDNALYKDKGSSVYNLYYTIGKPEEPEEPDVTPGGDENTEGGEDVGGEVSPAAEDDESVDITPVLVEQALPIERIYEEGVTVPKYFGTVTIPGLKNGDYYSLYYKKAVTKGKGNDVLNYFDSKDDGMRMFDGYYDAKAKTADGQSLYNFRYEIINNQLVDNKVTIKVLATEEILERIVGFKVKFVDSKDNTLEKNLGPLVSCGEDDLVGRCLSVNYSDLKNAGMKSDKDVENLIRVTVDAYYDNGLTGYDYVLGEEYDYMILQNNNTSAGMGAYVTISNGGQFTNWSPELNAAKGFYTYTRTGTRITYNNHFKSQKVLIPVSQSSSGFYNKDVGTLNPKMISIDEMTTDSNTFSFSSITPKMFTEVNTRLINGATIDIRLASPDLNDMYNEGTKDNPKYYVYIDVWDDAEKVGVTGSRVRPSAKVLINNENPGATITAIVDGLQAGKSYYYNVYAKMYKDNKVEYIQLFDSRYSDKFEAKTYNFSSLALDEVRDTISVSYTSLKEPYGNRELNAKITLKPYKKEYPFNFDLIYVLCKLDDHSCGIGEDSTNIYMKTFNKEEVFTTVTDKVDISNFNLEFDKDYYIGVYARANYYGNNPNGDANKPGKQDILLNEFTSTFRLNKLNEPTYVVSREALITEDGNYAIDFKVNVSDADRTIVGGKYYVKLLDNTGTVSGVLELKDEEGNYSKVSGDDYTTIPFDVNEANKSFRISGLKADTKYTIVVFADAFLNNYVEAEKDLTDEEKRVKRTVVSSKSHTVYSANEYGVAFGHDLLYSATANSIVVTFLGGSHFLDTTSDERYVTKVRYTVGLWDGPADASTISGTYDLEADLNKKFKYNAASDDWVFEIDPSEMKNTLNATYEVNLSFEIKYKGEYFWLTSAENAAFSGKAKYVQK